jgi:hypothetical protein
VRTKIIWSKFFLTDLQVSCNSKTFLPQ